MTDFHNNRSGDIVISLYYLWDIILNMTITKQSIKNVGSVLATVRKTEGISQTKLAKTMKREQAFVSNVERGRKVPSLKTTINYLNGLGYHLTIEKTVKK